MKKILKEDIDPNLINGDLVIVDGVFEDYVISVFKNAFGVIINQNLFENYHLIKFFDWNEGGDGWENPECGVKNCFYLPKEDGNKYFKGSIKLANKKLTVDDVSDIFSSLNENQEEDWWEHLMKDPNQKIRLDYYEDLHDKNKFLEYGDNIEVWVEGDGLEINGDAMIVDNSNDDNYLIKLPEVMWSDGGDPTHCGSKPKHEELCECREDEFGLETGKCWWIHLSYTDRLYLYPNRKGNKFLDIK